MGNNNNGIRICSVKECYAKWEKQQSDKHEPRMKLDQLNSLFIIINASIPSIFELYPQKIYIFHARLIFFSILRIIN